MFSSTLKRSVATLSIMAGLLAAAGPAGAQGSGADFPSTNRAPAVTMLDYMGSPLFDKSAPLGITLCHEGFEIR